MGLTDLERRLEVIEEIVTRIDRAIRGDGNGEPGYTVRMDRVERYLKALERGKLRRFTVWHGIVIAVLTVALEKGAALVF